MHNPDRTQAPYISNIPALSLPELHKVSLDNGIPVSVLDCGDVEVNRLTMIYDGGMAEAIAPVIPPMCLQLMREGCDGYSGKDIAEIMDFNGAWLKCGAQTHHSSISLYSLNSRYKDVLPVFHDIVSMPTFPDGEFEMARERAASNAEIARLRVDARSQQAIMCMIFGYDHPLARECGPYDIRSMTVDDIKSFNRAYFQMKRPVIYLAGKITSGLLEILNDTFGKSDIRNAGKLSIVHPKPDNENQTVVDIPDAQQCSVKIAVPTIDRKHHDYIDLRCAVIALGGYFGSRLMTEVRENQGLTYGISASLFGYPECGVMMIASQTDNTTARALIDATYSELKRLQQEPMKRDEFERLRRYIQSQLLSTFDSPFSIMDYYETLRLNFISDGYFQRQMDALAKLTPARLSEVLSIHINVDKLKIAVAGDQKSMIL